MSLCQTGVFASAKPRPSLLFWLLAGLASLWTLAIPLRAAESKVHIQSVQVGFRGVVEVGRWNSLSIRASGPSGTQITPRVTTADPEGRPVRQPGKPVVLGAVESVLSLVYQHGPIESPVIVELLNGDQVLDELTLYADSQNSTGTLQTVSQLTDFVVCLGEPQLGFEAAAEAAREIRRTDPDLLAPLLVQNYSLSQVPELPADVRGWESVDACVISADCVVPDALGALLKQWVHQGGRLVFIGGESVSSVTAPGLVNWLPVKLGGAMTLRDISSLSSEIPGSSTLRLREDMNAVRWVAEAGNQLSMSQGIPLVVRTGESLGTVTAISVDINAPPFVDTVGDRPSLAWDALPNLCRWLAGLRSIPKLEEGSKLPQSDLNPTGVSDLQTQLVNTLDRFPEVERPSYWVVLGTALLFLLIVGPLDYLLVHRVLKRPHWTWLTLPVWIVLGGVIGLSAATRTSGTRDLTRQLDMVTWDAEQHEVQVDSWLTLYSPQHHRYEVSCAPGMMDPVSKMDSRIRWAGRPEAGFRGLYRQQDISAGACMEQEAESRSVRSLPIRHGATSVLEAKLQWEQAPAFTNNLVETVEGHLAGTFSHQLDGELVDWVIAYDNFAYLPPRNRAGVESPLLAGETIHADQVPSRILADYLVRLRTRSVERQDKRSTDFSSSREVYDPLGRDLYTLLRTTTFHEAMGGAKYTGLSNSTLQNEDLTRLVDAKRAVVFGRWRNSAYGDSEVPTEHSPGGTEPLAAQYTVDGQLVSPRYRECFVRWILPVKQAANNSPTP